VSEPSAAFDRADLDAALRQLDASRQASHERPVRLADVPATPVSSAVLARMAVGSRAIVARHRRRLPPEEVEELVATAEWAEAELERRQLRAVQAPNGRRKALLFPLDG
jgi:hypothetical protein